MQDKHLINEAFSISLFWHDFCIVRMGAKEADMGTIKTLNELKDKTKQERKQMIAIANAADTGILQAVKMALEDGLCRFKLFGDKNKMEKDAAELGFVMDQWPSEELIIEHTEQIDEAAVAAVRSVSSKEADILMKGDIATKNILKAALNKEYGLRTGKILSHVALFEIPNQERLIFLTDAAMNIAPDLQQKAEIINNAVQIAQGIGVEVPKVAAITPVEVVNQAMPSTIDAAVLTQMQRRNQIKGCIIDGPLAFDNAVSITAANQKGIDSKVAGHADILLASSIEAGNALYKSFVYYAQAKVAAVISGAKVPIILTSRADTAENKLYSISLALVSSKSF